MEPEWILSKACGAVPCAVSGKLCNGETRAVGPVEDPTFGFVMWRRGLRALHRASAWAVLCRLNCKPGHVTGYSVNGLKSANSKGEIL